MTEKQYPLGSYTQDIYNFVSDEVFTGHLTVDRLPPPPYPSLATPLFFNPSASGIFYLRDSNLL